MQEPVYVSLRSSMTNGFAVAHVVFSKTPMQDLAIWPRGYKTFFMLNSTEHEIFPAHKC